MRILRTPEIPQSPVKVCAISEVAPPQILKSLAEKGIEVIKIPGYGLLPNEVASHADMQLRPAREGKILTVPHCGAKSALLEKGFQVLEIKTLPGKIYPEDVPLNSLILGGFCYGLLRSMAPELLQSCENDGIQPVNCAQGYARCSVAIAGADLAITADRGLYRLLSERKVECLLIPPGGILLPGYETGFIGGCCGLIDKETLAFTGSLDCYCQGGMIRNFLEEHYINICCLTDGPMVDLGGIIPLMEESEGMDQIDSDEGGHPTINKHTAKEKRGTLKNHT